MEAILKDFIIWDTLGFSKYGILEYLRIVSFFFSLFLEAFSYKLNALHNLFWVLLLKQISEDFKMVNN